MTMKKCIKCARFLRNYGDHECVANVGEYHRETHEKYRTNPPAVPVERVRSLHSDGAYAMKLNDLQILYMSQEAGLSDAPLPALKRFADLVRADMRSEINAESLRAIEQRAAAVGVTLK